MQSSRLLARSFRGSASFRTIQSPRYLSSTFQHYAEENPRVHSNVDEHREIQKSKANNPHLTNTTSTIKDGVPSVGADKAPPDLISSVDSDYLPKDDLPENTERMTGETQPGDPNKASNTGLGVGEMEGAAFKVEPLRRYGEDATTTRARLLCPSYAQTTPHSMFRFFSPTSPSSRPWIC